MNATTQRRVSIGLLGLAFAALGVDQFILGGGGPSAANAQQAVQADGTEVPVITENRSLARPAPKLAERLDSIARARPELLEPVPDLFFTPKAETWRVSSIIGRGERGAAVVNGTMLRAGQTNEQMGVKLVDVRAGEVVLRAGDREFTVRQEQKLPE